MRSTIREKSRSNGISSSRARNATIKKARKETNNPMIAKRIVCTAFLIFSSFPAERMKVIPPTMIYTKLRIDAAIRPRATNVATISNILAFSNRSLNIMNGGK
jgi:hypothetical protein